MDENVKTCPLCACDVLLEDCVDFHSVHVCRWCIYEIAKDYGRLATPLVMDVCPNCKGTGLDDGFGQLIECVLCHGKGRIIRTNQQATA